MTTTSRSEGRSKDRGAVAVECIALTSAAVGLCLCLLATPGGGKIRAAPIGHDAGDLR